ncbi:Protein suppressor of npr1-1, constitutive 1 [Vitis vinifera]|uniref:Protein suppressor of npr1-1, constitutive 1 n=1 Tax=Vitis vinifera TaxID=29760 RepID=A0A438GRU6_VITVI|nr:Protein suppressor of npr1-1, constitutive 1 [Vitis vinifera]
MHDLVQQMGQEIVHQECLKEPGNRSRLWDPDDVVSVLTRNMGTRAIEGIFVPLSLARCSNLESLPRNFHAIKGNMSKLRVIDLRETEIKDDMENLKKLDLGETGIKKLPSSIGRLKALQYLDLSFCENLANLPKSICNLSSLKTLILDACYNLKGFPEIKDDTENLKRLYLRATDIEELPSSIGRLKALQHLDLSYCKNLRSLSENIFNLSSLETLIVRECSNLKRFPEIKDDMENLKRLDLGEIDIEELPFSVGRLKALQHLDLSGVFKFKGFPEIKDDMENLKRLDLRETDIEELPFSVGRLKALQHLDLSGCKSLRSLSESICNLSFLETLIVQGCSNLKHFPEIKDDMENLKRLDFRETSIEELPSLIGRQKALQHLDLSSCKNLRSLSESIFNLSSLETLIVRGCSNLKRFPEIKDDMENLKMLDLRETGIEELTSSIGRLKALQRLDLSGCKSLRSLSESICNLSSLETLIVRGCSNLKRFPQIKDDMENLKMLDLRETGIEELTSSIGRLKALQRLDLSGCKSLRSLSESICNLSSLETLIVRGCSNLKRFPQIKDDMENLKRLDFRETSIEELPSLIGQELTSSIGRLKALQHLDLSGCKSLRSLSESICNLSSLETLIVRGCSNLKRFPEIKDDMENLKMLDLRETSIEELTSSIGRLKALQRLDLSSCKSLRSLSESIFNLSSLETLNVERCPKLERLEVNLVGSSRSSGSSDLTFCFLKQRVIWWGNRSFYSFKRHNEGKVLNHHVFSLLSLVELCERNSTFMESIIFSDCLHPSSLKVLSVGNFNTMERGILSDIFHYSSLKTLSLHNCNLMEEGILTNVWSLPLLEELSLSNCNLREGEILNHICHLSSLLKLSLDGNHFSRIPANIIQLSKLRTLDLSHCQKLVQIPTLPQSLRFLDAHGCPCLETLSSPSSSLGFSLFKCFKSAIEEFECRSYWSKEITIFIPGNNGIPEWISHKKKGSKIETELPVNWWEDNNFLGFAVFVPLHIESKEDPCSLTCELYFHNCLEYPERFFYELRFLDKLSFERGYPCCHNGGESNRVWVAYYPKNCVLCDGLRRQPLKELIWFGMIRKEEEITYGKVRVKGLTEAQLKAISLRFS